MLALAWPIVLANSAVPLLGLVDTAVIGNTGTVQGLGAIALGAIIFNFAYWSFGFLRMGTTGFTAQASGAGDEVEVRATLGRALLLAGGIALVLLALQKPLIDVALVLLGSTEDVAALTRAYFHTRIWGAPASLATFALLGTFVGLGRTRLLLGTQIALNGLNIILDVLFAGVLGWGVRGIAFGTAIAEWTTLVLALGLAYRLVRSRHADGEPFWPWARVLDRAKVLRTLGANADIMVRTLALLGGFAWFTSQGARFGDTLLAANHVLLQLVSASAYLLDGYAHATEVLVGRAVGARTRAAFDRAVRAATELAGGTAVVLTALIWFGGPTLIALLSAHEPVRDTAGQYLPYTAVYILVSFAAFQLDGIFIGATRTRDMRDAALVSLAVFLGASWLLVAEWANTGLWIAFVVYVVTRGLTLSARMPALRRTLAG
ncbi:MAG: MATE family efflux transporter [Gemmatimonadota bacterium]|nr:MATE family efflux transporter [Gemmatimonadota bacterium]